MTCKAFLSGTDISANTEHIHTSAPRTTANQWSATAKQRSATESRVTSRVAAVPTTAAAREQTSTTTFPSDLWQAPCYGGCPVMSDDEIADDARTFSVVRSTLQTSRPMRKSPAVACCKPDGCSG